MPLNRNISVIIGKKGGGSVAQELTARHAALGTWDKVAFSVGNGAFLAQYLWQVANGKRPPSNKLLRALGRIKPEKRDGIRVRMTLSDAREIVDHGTLPANVKNRISYALWGKK